MAIKALISNLQSISDNLNEIAMDAIVKNEDKATDLIKDQLDRGIRGDGKTIVPKYTSAYAKKKNRTIPDLQDTGKYVANTYLEKSNFDVVLVKSTRTIKGYDLSEGLEERYGREIKELTKESQKELAPFVWSDIYKTIKDEAAKGL